MVAGLVRYFKRSVTQKNGKNIWQRSFCDHIIRNETDYFRIWNYIETNPAKRPGDEYYHQEKR